MGHAFIGRKTYGSQTVAPGEYDTACFFTVILVIPLWVWYRGCFHVIEPLKLPPGRLERIWALTGAAGAMIEESPEPQAVIHLPLRSIPALKWMARLHWLMFFCFIGAFMGVIDTWVSCTRARPIISADYWVLGIGWSCAAILLLGWMYIRLKRRCSPRQARIRQAVVDWMGPYSDPADWHPQLVRALVAKWAMGAPNARALLTRAARLRESGQIAEACATARFAIALAYADKDVVLVTEAEELTDRCLPLSEADKGTEADKWTGVIAESKRSM